MVNIHVMDVDELLLDKWDDLCGDDILIKMRYFYSVIKAVQKDTESLADIRKYVDQNIDKFSSTAAYIA